MGVIIGERPRARQQNTGAGTEAKAPEQARTSIMRLFAFFDRCGKSA
jgi:hypothetical protein